MTEKEKYEKVWQNPEYGAHSPGLAAIPDFAEKFDLEENDRILDIGCGTGDAVYVLRETYNCDAYGLDIAENAIDQSYHSLYPNKWFIQDLNTFVYRHLEWDYIFSADVFEHLPTLSVRAVLPKILTKYRKGIYLQIALYPDRIGRWGIEEPLHLTVKPELWWKELLGDGNYTVTKDHKLTFWKGGDNDRGSYPEPSRRI